MAGETDVEGGGGVVPVGDESVRRAFLLLRDPLASVPRALGTAALLVWLPWYAGEGFGSGVAWGVVVAEGLLILWGLLSRRKTLRTAGGARGPMEEILRRDLRRREAVRPVFFVALAAMALVVGVNLVRGFSGEGRLDAFNVRFTVNNLLLGFLFAWDTFVTLPGARRLVGPDD